MEKEKPTYSTHILNHSFKVSEGQFIRITWEKGILGKKEFSSKLRCVDGTHFYGVAPLYMNGIKRIEDLWHTYYIPFKENIKSIEVLTD